MSTVRGAPFAISFIDKRNEQSLWLGTVKDFFTALSLSATSRVQEIRNRTDAIQQKNAKKRRVQQMPDKSALAGNQGYIKAVDIVLSGTRAFSDDVQFWVGNWDYLYKNNLLGKYDPFNKFSTTHKESSEYVE